LERRTGCCASSFPGCSSRPSPRRWTRCGIPPRHWTTPRPACGPPRATTRIPTRPRPVDSPGRSRMSDPNPLIAERVDSTTWSSGLWMLESIEDARSGIASGSWVDASLGVGGAAVSGLGLVVGRVGWVVWMGVGCLMEDVKPLSDGRDRLAGDPDQIDAYAQTWANVAPRAIESGEELAAWVAREV